METTPTENSAGQAQSAISTDENARQLLTNEIKKYDLQEETKVRLYDVFLPFLHQAAGWRGKAFALVVTDATQLTEMAQAREGRLILKGLRNETERTRKSLKEDSLAKGRAIDGIANIVKGIIEPIEEHLEKQEKFAEIKEAERKAALKITREQKLAPLGVTVEFYNLADMDEPSFAALLEQSQKQHQLRIDAAAQAQRDKDAAEANQRAEQERQRAENERLRKEAAEAAHQLALQNEAIAKQEAEHQKQLQAQRDEAARQAAAQEAKAKAEREEAQRLAAEQTAKAEAAAKEAARIANEVARVAAEHAAQIAAAKEAARIATEVILKAQADALAAKQAKENADFERAQQDAIRLQQEKDKAAQATNVVEQVPAPLTPPATAGVTIFDTYANKTDAQMLVEFADIIANTPLPPVEDFEAARIVASAKKYLQNTAEYIRQQLKHLPG